MVSYNVTGELPSVLPYAAGIWVLLPVAVHIAIRLRLPYADPVLLPARCC